MFLKYKPVPFQQKKCSRLKCFTNCLSKWRDGFVRLEDLNAPLTRLRSDVTAAAALRGPEAEAGSHLPACFSWFLRCQSRRSKQRVFSRSAESAPPNSSQIIITTTIIIYIQPHYYYYCYYCSSSSRPEVSITPGCGLRWDTGPLCVCATSRCYKTVRSNTLIEKPVRSADAFILPNNKLKRKSAGRNFAKAAQHPDTRTAFWGEKNVRKSCFFHRLIFFFNFWKRPFLFCFEKTQI